MLVVLWKFMKSVGTLPDHRLIRATGRPSDALIAAGGQIVNERLETASVSLRARCCQEPPRHQQ